MPPYDYPFGLGAALSAPAMTWAAQAGYRASITALAHRLAFAVMKAGLDQIGFCLSAADKAGQHAAATVDPAQQLRFGLVPVLGVELAAKG